MEKDKKKPLSKGLGAEVSRQRKQCKHFKEKLVSPAGGTLGWSTVEHGRGGN